MERPPEKKTEAELQDALGERDVEGIEELSADEQEAVVEAAESNRDPTTSRETIEQELMELGRSDAGSDVGD